MIFILPTKGPQGYRGKYPNRARSVSASRHMGTYVELNSGVRLWSITETLATMSRHDYTGELGRAVAMSDSHYAELSATADLAGTIKDYAGHTRRDNIRAQVAARRAAIGRPTVGVVTKGSDSRPGEGPPRMFVELCASEQREVAERGFPRGGDIRYFERKPYSATGYALTRWTRLPAPGNPRTPADDIAEAQAAPAQVRRDNSEYHNGRNARAAGTPLEACPHLEGGERAARWTLGWREAPPAHRRCGAVHGINGYLDAIRGLVDGPLGDAGPTTERTVEGLESILEALGGVLSKAQALRHGRPLSPLWIVDGRDDYRAGPYDTWAAAESALAMLRADRKPDAHTLRVDGGR